MKYNKLRIITQLFLFVVSIQLSAQNANGAFSIFYKANGTLLQSDYKTNAKQIEAIETWIKNEYRAADSTGGYVSIVANYVHETPQAINCASIQGSTFISHLRKVLRGKSLRYTFQLRYGVVSDCLNVECMSGSVPLGSNNQIYYTLNDAWVNRTVKQYASSAFVNGSVVSGPTVLDTKLSTAPPLSSSGDVRQVDIVFYYRFDKSTFDTTYLSNPNTLRQIDSLMQLPSARYIDSLRVLGHASPEGPLEYNRRLSQRRAQAMKDYLIKRYPDKISERTVITQAGGENWEGFRRMAEKDPNLPMKDKVMSILDNPALDDNRRQRQIEQLNQGSLYKHYLLPRYYRYLRSGASLFFLYNPTMPIDVNWSPRKLSVDPSVLHVDSLVPIRLNIDYYDPSIRYIRPIAIKTNMLADLATLLNVEVEVPIGRHFSLMGEWNFPFWGGLGNAGGVAPVPVYSENFTLQMLAGHLEARYWFARSRSLDVAARKWHDYNPLNGWFVGLYGGSGLYDFQWKKKGFQGEFFVSSGVTGGYAHPIAKHFHLEYSAGFGYLQTQYYNYTMKDGHKVVDIRDDGKYDRRQQSYLGVTKLKVSLVWIPQFVIKTK